MLYPWQQTLWQNWQQLLSQGRLHHAILLLAAKGSGREELAKQLAQTVLCQNCDTEPCGVCHSCQLFAAQTHPDFHHVAPLEEGKQIGVDAIRQCNRWAVETSQLAGQRVIMIEHADALGEAAANALLKTLEEPPSGCQFILTAQSLDSLLPTINSRCNKWRLAVPDEQETRRWVEKQMMQSVKLESVRLNGGAPLATQQFIEQGQDIRHGNLLEAFSRFLQPPFTGIYDIAALCTKEGIISLKWLSYFLVDCIKLQQGAAAHLVHRESLDKVQAVASQVTPAVLMTQVRKANELHKKLEKHTGLNEELLIVEWLTGFIAH
ncbi:DNA polymerase III subunit delta' [Photobacterium sp. SDRW27]|uniref:DNA polymerase III subunit delta' n=1 Tax=Photobacterium obscurum TaxID=2829490 RepID=UPI002242D227|nr:DNA polymerase III subunit delta' [Photobacterium obscurum]MCW8330807.1 DNA polymerase III subunit delta' [Photobacterium obscurum]